MFSTSARFRRVLPALLLALGFSGAAWGQAVVVASSGPSARAYPAGKALAAGSSIVLRAGDTLTVLDNRGTRVLRGPLTTTASASAATANPSFAALVATQNRRRARTGAIRGSGETPRPANLWQIDITRAGTVCVADPATVQLWRPDMQQAATLAISDETPGSETASATAVPFDVGQNAAVWPANLPLAAGKVYELSDGGLAKPVKVRVALLSSVPGDPAGLYSALDSKGCNVQKQLLVGAMQSSE